MINYGNSSIRRDGILACLKQAQVKGRVVQKNLLIGYFSKEIYSCSPQTIENDILSLLSQERIFQREISGIKELSLKKW